jgi:hypothetical protein
MICLAVIKARCACVLRPAYCYYISEDLKGRLDV